MISILGGLTLVCLCLILLLMTSPYLGSPNSRGFSTVNSCYNWLFMQNYSPPDPLEFIIQNNTSPPVKVLFVAWETRKAWNAAIFSKCSNFDVENKGGTLFIWLIIWTLLHSPRPKISVWDGNHLNLPNSNWTRMDLYALRWDRWVLAQLSGTEMAIQSGSSSSHLF